jgi:hypothetical protein
MNLKFERSMVKAWIEIVFETGIFSIILTESTMSGTATMDEANGINDESQIALNPKLGFSLVVEMKGIYVLLIDHTPQVRIPSCLH